jgi:hypothetical protein
MKAAIFAAVLAGGLILGGCQATPSQADLSAEHSNQALNDPMNYSPSMDNTDISGGDTGSFDGKAMQRDINDFWNP